MQPGEKVNNKTKHESAGGGEAFEEPLVIDGFPVDDEKLPGIEDLPSDLQDIAEIIGVRQVIQIALRFPGCSVNFPAFKRYRASLRNERVRADYDGGVGVKTLSKKYGLSERHIWSILGS